MSQTPAGRRCLYVVTTDSETIMGADSSQGSFDLDTVFRANYARVARAIDGVLRDPARSEELAVEVFLKLWRTSSAQGEQVEGWLYRAAVRKALDETRRRSRRERYERLMTFVGLAPSPEDVRSSNETQQRVRIVLANMKTRQAELLLLRNLGLSYDELSSALSLNFTSVGALLSRAQRTFRKEYTKRYGKYERS
jgi:RNA polymerase sigma-70 factor (ECF subfamily)